MSTATRIINAVRGLREEADFEPEEADAIGVAAAEVAEAVADRIIIRLGAWILGVVAVATTILIAAMQLTLD